MQTAEYNKAMAQNILKNAFDDTTDQDEHDDNERDFLAHKKV